MPYASARPLRMLARGRGSKDVRRRVHERRHRNSEHGGAFSWQSASTRAGRIEAPHCPGCRRSMLKQDARRHHGGRVGHAPSTRPMVNLIIGIGDTDLRHESRLPSAQKPRARRACLPASSVPACLPRTFDHHLKGRFALDAGDDADRAAPAASSSGPCSICGSR